MAAVGLPIYIHLLRQHQAIPLKFSSLMLFERHVQSSIKHRRLRYLLLFALRTALVVLLVLAFADPFTKTRALAPASGQKLIVLAIDNSFSMRAGNRLEQARREAASVLAAWKPGNLGEVLAFGSSVQLMTQPTPQVAELRAAVQAIRQEDGRSSFAELARALRSIAQGSSPGSADAAHAPSLEVHLFSDMQKSALPASFGDLQLAANTRLVLHPVASGREPNWAVESVSAPHRVNDPRKARVQATIAGYGTPAARRNASLVVNGRVVDTRTVEVPANGRATVEFPKLEVPYGMTRCEVRIDAADKLPADDQFLFSVERSDPEQLLFVYESRQPRGLTYFRTAMDASLEAGFTVEGMTAEQAGNVALSKYAVVVLSDVAWLPPGFEDALRSRVRSGGGVLIAAGPATASRPRVPLFDQPIVGARYAGREGERFQAVADVDASHPALQRVNKFENVKFYQATRIDPGPARVLARLSDQTPLLLEKQIGEGRVLVFASTFDNISNDLPLHTSFVPFVEQAARYLAGHGPQPSAYLVDSHFDLRTAREQGVAVEVLDPSGERPLSLGEATSAATVQLGKQGYYSVRRANGRQELAAVNADRRESDLEVLPADTTALWQNTGEPSASSGATTEARPFRLWWYLMLAVFLVAVAESLVGSRYLAAKREEA
jgi:hypothetical protein